MIKDLSIKFFHFNKLKLELHPEVYDPAEDSFILIEILDNIRGSSVLEIGTGCGLIALECARAGADVVCTDINPYAVDLVNRNYLRNKSLINGNFEVRLGDLFNPINQREVFDIIIFNPPYLPTKKNEMVGESGWFDVANDGGIGGIKITTLFIDKLPTFLNKKGRAYFIFSSLSDRNCLESFIEKKKFQFKIVKSSSFNDETISVYCLIKKKKD